MLVDDDDEDIRAVLAEALQDAGCEGHLRASGPGSAGAAGGCRLA